MSWRTQGSIGRMEVMLIATTLARWVLTFRNLLQEVDMLAKEPIARPNRLRNGTARVGLLFGVLLFGSAATPSAAQASNQQLFFGSKVPGASVGPVLTGAHIIPVFYGDWSNLSGPALTYLGGFVNWIAGAGDPSTSEQQN